MVSRKRSKPNVSGGYGPCQAGLPGPTAGRIIVRAVAARPPTTYASRVTFRRGGAVMSATPFFQIRPGLFLLALITTVMVRPVTAGAAEESEAVRSAESPCLWSRPYPECRVFFVTNAGVYARLAGGLGGGPMRVVLDGGAMVNLSPKNAVGGSWFVAWDEDQLSTGPVLRWRRWLGPTQSLDFAVGTIIAGGDAGRPGSVLGLVKYNPVHWFGIAARPELLRHSGYYDYDPTGSREVAPGTKARLYLGAEFGGKPGLVTGAGVLVLSVLAIAALASSFD